MPRFLTAREQYEMLTPWLREALDMAPNARPPSGAGAPNEGYGQRGATPHPDLPKAPKLEDAPWMGVDWKSATDYGHLNSTSRPPMLSDVPHPSQVLDPKNPDHRKTRIYNVVNQKSGVTTQYHLPSWWDAYKWGMKNDPDRDPYGVMAPYKKVLSITPESKGPRGGVIKPRATNVTADYQRALAPNAQGLAQNNLDHHDAQTPDQAYQGRVWYRAAHEGTKDLADKTTGDHEKTVHTMSAYSPKTEWDENMEKGHHFILNYDPRGVGPVGPNGESGTTTPVIPGMQSPMKKAMEIYHAPPEDVAKVNSGAKTSSFAYNILDKTPMREPRTYAEAHEHMLMHYPGMPEEESPYFHPANDPEARHQTMPDDAGYYQHPINPVTGKPDFRLGDPNITVDTHDVRMKNTRHGDLEAIRALKYGTPPHFEAAFTVNGQTIRPGYDLYARMGAEATHAANLVEPDYHKHLLPKQLQAGPWGKFKDDLNEANNKHPTDVGEAPKGLQDTLQMKKNRERDPAEVEQEWGERNPLTHPAMPRYEYDSGEFWRDPTRRPEIGQDRQVPTHWKDTVPSEETRPGGLRSLPNWGNRPRDEQEWADRDMNQYLTDRWGEPPRGRWARRTAQTDSSWWDSVLDDYINRNPQHPRDTGSPDDPNSQPKFETSPVGYITEDQGTTFHAHLGAFYDPFLAAVRTAHDPWQGEAAEALDQPCPHCGAARGELCDISCPSLQEEGEPNPEQWYPSWKQDQRAQEMIGPAFEPDMPRRYHLNSVQETLDYVDRLLGDQ